jgi:hypothetical protein
MINLHDLGPEKPRGTSFFYLASGVIINIGNNIHYGVDWAWEPETTRVFNIPRTATIELTGRLTPQGENIFNGNELIYEEL